MKNNSIEKYITKALKDRNAYNETSADELTLACLDEYKLNIEKGLSQKEAFNKTIVSLNKTLDASYYYVNRNNRYIFPLIFSSVALILCFVVLILGTGIADVLHIFRILYPIGFLIVTIALIYPCCTYKKRNLIDFTIVVIVFLGVLCTSIQGIIYFYRATTGNFYYSLFYSFPGILEFNRHVLVSTDPLLYKISNTKHLFDPTLILSFICFICSIILYVVERRKKHVNNFN